MTEDPEALKIELMAQANQIKEVDVGLEKPVRIKPLTWQQEAAIAGAAANLVKKGVPQEVADREYMKLTVHAGLVEPKMTEAEVEVLKVGIVMRLNSEIGKISGGLQKK